MVPRGRRGVDLPRGWWPCLHPYRPARHREAWDPLGEHGQRQVRSGHSAIPTACPFPRGCQETASLLAGSRPPPASGHSCRPQDAGSSALDSGHLASLFQGHPEQGPPGAGTFGCSSLTVCGRQKLSESQERCLFLYRPRLRLDGHKIMKLCKWFTGRSPHSCSPATKFQSLSLPLPSPWQSLYPGSSTSSQIYVYIQKCVFQIYIYVSKTQMVAHYIDASVPYFFQITINSSIVKTVPRHKTIKSSLFVLGAARHSGVAASSLLSSFLVSTMLKGLCVCNPRQFLFFHWFGETWKERVRGRGND